MFKVTIHYTLAQEKAVRDVLLELGCIYDPCRYESGYEETFSTSDYHDIERLYRLLIAGTITFYSVEFYDVLDVNGNNQCTSWDTEY